MYIAQRIIVWHSPVFIGPTKMYMIIVLNLHSTLGRYWKPFEDDFYVNSYINLEENDVLVIDGE